MMRFLLLYILLLSNVYANTEYLVQSIYDGHTPYLVVQGDEGGASQRVPGVYCNNEGNWKPLLPGHVATGRANQGILAQLSLSKLDRRYETLLVVDGKLRLVQLSQNPESVITFGEGDARPVDVYGTEVSLPLITRTEDVVIEAMDHTSEDQLVFVSMRTQSNNGGNPFGDGITFAFVLKKGISQETPIKISGHPRLLEYQFLDPEQLRALKAGGVNQVYSKLLLQTFARPQKIKDRKEPSLLVSWKNRIENFIQKSIVDRYVYKNNSSEIPALDLITGEVILEKSKRQECLDLRGALVHQCDVLTGRSEVLYSGKKILDGMLDERLSSNASHIESIVYENEGNFRDPNGCNYLTFVDRLPFAICGNGTMVPLEKRAGAYPDKAAFISRTVDIKNRQREHYLFVSFKYSNGNANSSANIITKVYVLLEYAPNLVLLNKELPLFNSFVAADELNARVKVGSDSEILIDLDTPVQVSSERYRQSFEPTRPLLNVTATQYREYPEIYYLQPLAEKAIPKVPIVYKKYEKSLLKADQSALILPTKTDADRAKIKSELLLPGPWEEITNPEIASKETKIKDRTPIHISVVALDTSFTHGDRGFSLATIISYLGDERDKAYFEPQYFLTYYSFPFKQLNGVWLVQGGPKNENYFSLVVSKSSEVASSTLLVEGWGLTRVEGAKDLIAETRSVKRLGDFNYDPLSFLNRVRMDSNGGIYWVIDPEQESTELEFQVGNLITGELVSPNRGDGKRINLLSAEESQKYLNNGLEAREEAGVYSHKLNKWRVFSPKEAERILVGSRKEDRKNKEKETDPLLSFPGLAEELERIAELSGSPQHKVYLVSDKAIGAFKQAIYKYSFGDRESHQKFHAQNYGLSIHLIDPAVNSQSDILETFESMREMRTRPVLMGDLRAVENIYADQNGNPFVLTHSEGAASLPSLLYLLAAEGRRIPYSDSDQLKNLSKSISMALVTTPSHWKALIKNDQGFPVDWRTNFVVDKRFLMGSWRVSSDGETRKKYVKVNIEFEEKILPGIQNLLTQIANPNEPARHQVLIVPPEIKELVLSAVMSKWFSENGGQNIWNYRNADIDLYRLEPRKAQDVIFENFEAMRGQKNGRRAVLVGDLQDVITSNRPEGGQRESFTISDWAVNESEGAIDSLFTSQKRRRVENGSVQISSDQGTYPHLLYLLETEGKTLSTKVMSENGSLPHRVSIFLVGEAEEWEEIKDSLQVENKVNLAERFEILNIASPSLEQRSQILSDLLSAHRRLGYTFDAQGLKALRSKPVQSHSDSMEVEAEESGQSPDLSQEISKEKLLGYLVNRSQKAIGDFVKVLANFKNALIEDPELRRNKVINRNFIERLLSKTFNLPLNINILEPDDPYTILNRSDAPSKLNDAGYLGSLDLKQRVIQALLAPTRNESTLAVPGSIILMGETSTGKTMLFKSFMKILGLKPYDYHNPDYEDAGYMVVDVGRLTSSVNDLSPSSMNVDTAIRHINHFLSLPKGYRGHILFDDIHKGDSIVIKKLVKFLQSLFEAENGILRVERLGTGRITEIPTRYIHPWMTLNSTLDKDQMERFSNRSVATDIDVAVATLSTEDNRIERSFLMRWGLIMNLSKFPLDAKIPALIKEVRKASVHDFNRQGQLVFVTPSAINKVVKEFPNANAREFLPTASSELLKQASEVDSKFPVYVVVPRAERRRSLGGVQISSFASGREDSKIGSFIQESTIALPLEDVMGKLHLAGIMVDTLRTTIYESLVDSMSQNPAYCGNSRLSSQMLAPVLHAFTSNLAQKEYMPWQVLNLDVKEMLSAGHEKQFRTLLESEDRFKTSKPFFDPKIPLMVDYIQIGNDLLSNHTSYYQDRQRSHVMVDYLEKISRVVVGFAQTSLRVGSLDFLPSTVSWAQLLGAGELDRENAALAQELSDLYLEFSVALSDPELVENRQLSSIPIGPYESGRLFSILIDRAISKLPWGRMTRFMLENLIGLSQDLELSQRPGVQYYLFSSKSALISSSNHEYFFQKAENIPSYKSWTKEQKQQSENRFDSQIYKAFAGGR